LSFETGGVVRMKIHGQVTNPTSAGAITMPYQPSVLVHNSSSDYNVTGDATLVTVDLPTELFDQGGDFASDTFTAPVTGRYLMTSTIEFIQMTSATQQVNLYFNTSNRTHRAYHSDRNSNTWDYATFTANGSVISDMDAGDTLTLQALVSGMGKDVDIVGASSGITRTFLSINLLA